jgi:hypothetical protein
MILYTALVLEAIRDMVRVVPRLRHVDPRRLAVVAAPRVSASHYGSLAQCFALRQPERIDFSFWYDRTTRSVVRATPWIRHANVPVTLHGVEMLYIVQLRLPRLLGHDPLETLVHELVHIGADFDGRLHPLRHGQRFDGIVAACTEVWRREGDPRLVEALGLDYAGVVERWGSVVGESFATPLVTSRLVPAVDPPPYASHPAVRRLRLRCDPATIKIVEPDWTGADVPAQLSEHNLVFRLYTPQTARRIGAAAVRTAVRGQMKG